MTKKKKEIVKKDLIKKDIKETKENEDIEFYKIYPDEKSHTWLKIIITILIILLCGLLFYKFVIWNNKGIFSSGINSVYNGLSQITNKLESMKLFNDGNELDGVLSFNTNNSNLKELSNYQYDVNGSIDIKNKRLSGSLKILNNNESIFNLDYNYQNKEQYVAFENIYDKIIKLNDNNKYLDMILDNAKEINYDKLNISLKKIKDIINNNIPANNLTSNEETISINDQKYDLKYISLKLNKEEYNKLLTNVKNDIEDNHQLVANLEEALDISEEDVNNYLNELLKESLVGNFNNIEVKIYINGWMANIIGVDILTDDTSVFKVISIDNNTLINIIFSNYDVAYLNDKITIKSDEDEITGTINELNNNIIDIDYNAIISDKKYYGNIHLDNQNESDNKEHGKICFSIVTSDNINYSYSLDYSFYNNIEIESLDPDKIIKMEDLSESDYLDIYNKINNKTKETIYNELILILVGSFISY